MESNAPQFIERPENVARLFKQTLYWTLAVTSVVLAGIIGYAIYCDKKQICFNVFVLSIWALVAYAPCVGRVTAANGCWRFIPKAAKNFRRPS